GFVYVNSGAMYRAITWYVLEHGLEQAGGERIAELIKRAKIRCEIANQASRVIIDDVDPAIHLREARVNKYVSQVSAVAQVRGIVDGLMRACARDHDLVVEGRDIGSIVFPETPYKFYVDASPEVRRRRRAAEGQRDEIAAR